MHIAVKKNQSFLDERLLDPSIEAGAEGIGLARGAAGRDLQEIADVKTGLLGSIAAPARERERKALEARLLSQGRLGASSGALAEQAQQGAFEQAQLQEALAGLDLAERERQNQFGMGLNLAQLGLGAAGQEVGFGFESRALKLQQQQVQARLDAERKAKKGNFGKAFLGAAAGAVGTVFGGPVGGALASGVVNNLTEK